MTATDALPAFHGVYLTFDDGPDPTWTPRCLELLAQARARATFFMIGMQARRYPQIVREIVRAGHAIGNHTLTHAHPWTISTRRARAEVRDGAAALASICGRPPVLFRPPYGARRPCMLEQARAQGETVVMWHRSAIDWGWLGSSERIAKRLACVRLGEIVLMHDGANRHNRPDQLLSVLRRVLRGIEQRSSELAIDQSQ